MLEQFWSAFVAATGIDGPHEAWSFGEGDQADELARLVRDGPKRATAGLYAQFEQAREPLPEPGDLSVILDGRGAPVCVIRTTEVTVKPFAAVDDQFAWDEGEGDRSLDYWRNAHRDFFAGYGVELHPETEMVLMRFELLWSPDGPTD